MADDQKTPLELGAERLAVLVAGQQVRLAQKALEQTEEYQEMKACEDRLHETVAYARLSACKTLLEAAEERFDSYAEVGCDGCGVPFTEDDVYGSGDDATGCCENGPCYSDAMKKMGLI